MSVIAKEVKEEILGRIKAGEKVKEVSSQYGLSDRTIYAWLRIGATSRVSILELNRLKKENQELKAIAGSLMFQLEKLKKKRWDQERHARISGSPPTPVQQNPTKSGT